MSRLRQLQLASLWIALACGLMALLTSGGCSPLPPGHASWATWLHPLLLAWGSVFGYLTVLRSREIDCRRFEIVSDPDLTKGEREWAHKEAEQQRNRSGAMFLAGALMLAGWFSYHLRAEAQTLAGELLPVSAFLGFGAGLLAAHLRGRSRREASSDSPSSGATS